VRNAEKKSQILGGNARRNRQEKRIVATKNKNWDPGKARCAKFLGKATKFQKKVKLRPREKEKRTRGKRTGEIKKVGETKKRKSP